MSRHFHTVVVGGGCLGCASAISVKRRIRRNADVAAGQVCLLEKSVVGSGLSARHSGIVRAANAVPKAAYLAKRASDYWCDLKSVWGVPVAYETVGAVWIARAMDGDANVVWNRLAEAMTELDIEFRQIDRRKAKEICTRNVKLHDDEVYYFEPNAMQFEPSTLRHVLYAALQENDIELLEGLSRDVMRGSLCGLGATAPNPVLTTLRYFREEYVSHVESRTCPALACRDFIRFEIDEEKCTGCTACAALCPVDGIAGSKKHLHVINATICIKCGVCSDTCNFDAVETVDANP